MTPDRYTWGPADLVPTDKAGRDAMASRTMNAFIRSAARRRQSAAQHPPTTSAAPA